MSNGSRQSDLKERVTAGLARRYRRERTFRLAGLGALLAGLAFLAFFLVTLIGDGYTAFRQTMIELEVEIPATILQGDESSPEEALAQANYLGMIRDAPASAFW